MPNQFDQITASLKLNPQSLRRQIDRLLATESSRHARLWNYYRNPMRPSVDESAQRPYRQAQEWGLPRRIVGDESEDIGRKEVVIENDIGWRIDAMIDLLVGSPIEITSTVTDPLRRDAITSLVRAVFENHGGIVFFQHLALLGAVHGHVDVLVKLLPLPTESAPMHVVHALPDATHDPADSGASTHSPEAITRLARQIRLEIVEPARALPLLDSVDRNLVRAYIQVFQIPRASDRESAGDPCGQPPWYKRFWPTVRGVADSQCTRVEILAPESWLVFEDDRLIAQGQNALGQIPLAHIQNVAMPFAWSGGGDVEPLIPLQDEINTRMSDRAHRITMQSFRMYLGKGIDNFTDQTISPGRMWMSDNADAQIVEFGGDAACPSEDAHISQLREAMDKTSGVTPIAAGILKNRIGQLTSAAALRVTMASLLARTQRKQTTYGGGIRRICDLALSWLDRAALFKTSIAERGIQITWPEPIESFSGLKTSLTNERRA